MPTTWTLWKYEPLSFYKHFENKLSSISIGSYAIRDYSHSVTQGSSASIHCYGSDESLSICKVDVLESYVCLAEAAVLCAGELLSMYHLHLEIVSLS